MTETEITSNLSSAAPVSVQLVPVAEMTPAKSEAVTEVAPILTPDPYPILHATRINSTPMIDRLNRALIFKKTYHLTGGAEGLSVNVVEGPMYIVYEVTPQYDCMAMNCRGDNTKPIQRPYLTLTVRDNQTHEIIAVDGYAREYSWDPGNYEYSHTYTSDDPHYKEHTSTDIKIATGPRYIPVNREGRFDITIEGAYLDANLKILTGPTLEGLTESSQVSPTPTEEISPEEEERW